MGSESHVKSLYYYRSQVGDPRPLFCGFACYRALDVSPLQVSLGCDYHCGVVFEDNVLPADPPYRVLLADYHCAEHCLLQVRGTLLNNADYRIPDRRRWDTAEPSLGLRHLDHAEGLCAGVVCAGYHRVKWDCPRDVVLELLYSLRRYCTRFRRHQVPLLDSTTTKETVLDSGLHSPIVTQSPSWTSMHGGKWALTLLLLLSPLLNLGIMWRYSISTTAKPLPAVETALPDSSLPLTFRLPWNGHLSSSHFFLGAATSSPAVLIVSSPTCLRAFRQGQRPSGWSLCPVP